SPEKGLINLESERVVKDIRQKQMTHKDGGCMTASSSKFAAHKPKSLPFIEEESDEEDAPISIGDTSSENDEVDDMIWKAAEGSDHGYVNHLSVLTLANKLFSCLTGECSVLMRPQFTYAQNGPASYTCTYISEMSSNPGGWINPQLAFPLIHEQTPDIPSTSWLLDSGATSHFTGSLEDFTEYVKGDFGKVKMPKGTANMTASGTVFLQHLVKSIDGTEEQRITRLHPVYYVPNMQGRLLSMGAIIRSGFHVYGNEENLFFFNPQTKDWKSMLSCSKKNISSNAYYVDADIASEPKELAMSTIRVPDYETWHRRLAHPSDEILKQFGSKTIGFTEKSLKNDGHLCHGCALGRTHLKSFPTSDTRAIRPFELIHSDLKEYPKESYHRWNYYISFIDDFTGYAW